MEKDYGKLTVDQFRRFVRKLPEFRVEYEGLEDMVRSASPEKLRELIGDGLWWAPLYELSLIELLAWMLYVLGEIDHLKMVVQQPDPQEILIKEMEDDRVIEWNGGTGGAFKRSDLVLLAMALQRNVLSIMVFQRSIATLVKEAGDGDDNSLFDAVRLDRSAVSCPTIAARISKAELLGEKRFFHRLRSALKGPQQKHWKSYQDLRYSLAMLREMGFDKLSDDQLEHLLIDVLKVYKSSPNARKNLRKQYYESKKLKSL
jgi:hypothetical protein